MQIRVEDPGAPDIVALLEEHLRAMFATSPAESVHALDVARLRARGVTFVAARQASGELMGVGALAALDSDSGEVKSMRTVGAFRGQGVAGVVLEHLVGLAKSRGWEGLYLETGSGEYFATARRLYLRRGFVECGPFGEYVDDPYSVFFWLDLREG
jgi:putative acetyltransferase